jgi:hypothetical protein
VPTTIAPGRDPALLGVGTGLFYRGASAATADARQPQPLGDVNGVNAV